MFIQTERRKGVGFSDLINLCGLPRLSLLTQSWYNLFSGCKNIFHDQAEISTVEYTYKVVAPFYEK